MCTIVPFVGMNNNKHIIIMYVLLYNNCMFHVQSSTISKLFAIFCKSKPKCDYLRPFSAKSKYVWHVIDGSKERLCHFLLVEKQHFLPYTYIFFLFLGDVRVSLKWIPLLYKYTVVSQCFSSPESDPIYIMTECITFL